MPPNGSAGVKVGEEPCVCCLVPVGLELTETLLPLLPRYCCKQFLGHTEPVTTDGFAVLGRAL